MKLVQSETELGSGQRDTVVGQRDWAIPALLVGCAFGFRIAIGYLFTYYGGDAPGYTVIGRNASDRSRIQRRPPRSLSGNGHPVAGLPSFVGSGVLRQQLALGRDPPQCAAWSQQYAVRSGTSPGD